MYPLEEMAVNIGPIEHSSNDNTTHTVEKHTLIVNKNVQIDRIPLQYQYTHNRECKKGSPRYEPVVTDVLGRDERVATESLLRECRDNIENPMQRKLVTNKIMGKVNSEVVQQCIKYRNKQYAWGNKNAWSALMQDMMRHVVANMRQSMPPGGGAESLDSMRQRPCLYADRQCISNRAVQWGVWDVNVRGGARERPRSRWG